GTSNAAHRSMLQQAVQRASEHDAVIVGAVDTDVEWMPGSLEGVIPVMLDWDCPRREYRIVTHNGRAALAASGYPREIPNVSPERNLKGVSFAVANASGFVARARQASRSDRISDIWRTLESGAHMG